MDFQCRLYLVGVIFSYAIHTIDCGPIAVRQNEPESPPDRTISLGPCTWVIDRKCPDNDVKFYLFTRNNKDDRQFVHIDDTLEESNLTDSNFNPMHPTKIIIHGYNSDMFLNSLIQMKDEYLQKGDYNLFYVDWSVLTPGPCYISGVHNTRHTGKCTAQLVERILDSGSSDIHVVGFSLGAQLANFIARNLGSFKLPRITGLDPAMPLFITAGIDDKLDESDAEYVDVIHTNALVQGKMERCGHADFYMNGGIMQPGCIGQSANPFACSHQRAPDYFMESIRTFTGFWGWYCSSYITYLLGMCPPTNFLVEAGENINTATKGMFIIVTNDVYPFARGKWTDIDIEKAKRSPLLTQPITRHSPLMKQVDQWGKLDYSYNNVVHFPTPYSQDPNGENWPYFGHSGTKEITQDLKDKEEEDVGEASGEESNLNALRRKTRPTNSKFRRKPSQPTARPNTQRKPSTERPDSELWKDYRRNLTSGYIENSIFQMPLFSEGN